MKYALLKRDLVFDGLFASMSVCWNSWSVRFIMCDGCHRSHSMCVCVCVCASQPACWHLQTSHNSRHKRRRQARRTNCFHCIFFAQLRGSGLTVSIKKTEKLEGSLFCFCFFAFALSYWNTKLLFYKDTISGIDKDGTTSLLHPTQQQQT